MSRNGMLVNGLPRVVVSPRAVQSTAIPRNDRPASTTFVGDLDQPL